VVIDGFNGTVVFACLGGFGGVWYGTYNFRGFGEIHGPEPYNFIGFGDPCGTAYHVFRFPLDFVVLGGFWWFWLFLVVLMVLVVSSTPYHFL
jgi:hypothetical protein